MLCGRIDTDMAHMIISKLLYLDAEGKSEIYMYINSPGGSAIDALAIYDAMQNITSLVITICMGEAASAASMLFCSGDKRILCEHARLLIHQPMGGTSGQASDLKIYVNELKILEEQIIQIYQRHTGIHREALIPMLERDRIIRNHEAIELGFADEIMVSKKDKKQ